MNSKHLIIFIICGILCLNLSVAASKKYDFIVAKDGSGNFTTIQKAVDSCRDYAERPYAIFVKNGVYIEKLVIPAWKTHISIEGESADSTILSNNDFTGKVDSVSGTKFRTFTSYTCLIVGNDNSIQDMTIANTAGRVGQAVALHVEGDRCAFRRCRLIGNQDTHLVSGEESRQYYQDCYIEGTTDFIFGAATAVFDRCTIVSKSNSYITAASTIRGREFGFVFFDCKLLADTAGWQVYLGRPWRLYAAVTFIRCEMGNHIRAEGWHNWNKPEAEKTARYFEYKSFGPGANPAARVAWSHQLTDEEAAKITPERVLRGTDNWNPARSDH
ncbi:MAG: pectinesterase family protein [Bacteroidota bacterium]